MRSLDPEWLRIAHDPIGGRPRRFVFAVAPSTLGSNCQARLVEEELRDGRWRETGREPARGVLVNGEPLGSVLRAEAIRTGRPDL